MYKTYGEIYNGIPSRYKNNSQTYFSDLQTCNKNIPVGSITCPDYLPSCKPDSVNSSTNNTSSCKPRLFPPNWPYREIIYKSPDDSKYNWIRESYTNSLLNTPHNSWRTSPYQGMLDPYQNLKTLYNPKLSQITF